MRKGRPDPFLGGKLLLIKKRREEDRHDCAMCGLGHSNKRGGRLSCMQRGMKHPFVIPESDALAIVI